MNTVTHREFTETENHLLVGYWLGRNQELTPALVADKLGVHHSTAWRILNKAERALGVVTGIERREER